MSAKIINGTEIARTILKEVREEVARVKRETGKTPGLAVVLVGDDPASEVYVRAKEKACAEAGIASFARRLPASVSEREVLALVAALNTDPKVHGILIQIPLPPSIGEGRVMEAVDPDKDVDGFHPRNLGKLLMGEETFVPCTPAGIQELIIREGIEVEGKHVVIVGRSNIVGKPLAAILMQKAAGANATVTVCHTGTKDLSSHALRADILVAAAGKAGTITASMIKTGAVVIDVGVNEVGRTTEGKRILAGDVDFEGVKEKAFAITPVPGGVGPMTIAMLLKNTLKAFKISLGDGD
ncbi:MAG: bifunctional methylenetetrahydrofolate dehydrogenase/methenyltetrahydrofolate cyclohydrolase FolD [Candidatus Aureabacteria bacterium]|nr:bifunctional methylenetetrahydrofolate dehydrogenase/methenyltetrahydrofolate cyclohydrolase FolD [Candidatus Auribacterota bacterium]